MAKRTVRPTLAREDWKRVFGECDTRCDTGRRDKAMYYFMYATGIRVGELVNLRLKDVNLKTGRFTTPPEGKTGQRKLALPDSVLVNELLVKWLAQRSQSGVESVYFFCTQSGLPVSRGSFASTLKARGKKAGITQKISPHWIRHSFASERVNEGISVTDLMGELGHTSVKTTMIYLHQDNTRAVGNMRGRTFE